MARSRALAAKQRELAAHKRAVVLHQQAAELQRRLGFEVKARAAWERAERAQDLHDLALIELADLGSWAVAGMSAEKAVGEAGPA